MIYRNAWQVNRTGSGTKEAIMQIDIARSTLTLAPAGLITVQDGIGTRIVVRSGVLWITQEGDVKDTIASAGDMLTIRKPGRTVITALESSSLNLFEPDAEDFDAGAKPYGKPRVINDLACC